MQSPQSTDPPRRGRVAGRSVSGKNVGRLHYGTADFSSVRTLIAYCVLRNFVFAVHYFQFLAGSCLNAVPENG